MNLLPTGLAAKPPSGSYLRIAPRSGLTVKNSLHTLAGVVDPDYTGNITVVMHNFGTTPQTFQRGDKIAQIIVENASTPEMVEVKDHHSTSRSASGFGSTDKQPAITKPTRPPHPPSKDPTIKDHDLPENRKPPDKVPFAATAAAVEMNNSILTDLHLSFWMPYDLNLSNSPLDNQTFRTVATTGNDPKLGFDLHTCPNFGLPRVKDCKRSTPCAKLPRWRSELRGAYVTSVNGIPVSTVSEYEERVQQMRQQGSKEIEIGFATVEKAAMHPQLGVPQIYHDQLNVIGEHLWDLRYDPEWRKDIEDALPVLEVIQQDTYSELSQADKEELQTLFLRAAAVKKKTSLKQQRKLTRQILQKLPDWEDWKASEFKQLDQYHDQDTFGEPECRPRGANLLNLLWCYLVKDDGHKKAQCVCNGNKNRRGTVTLAETYAASLEQTASRVFWAATAINNFITIGADAS